MPPIRQFLNLNDSSPAAAAGFQDAKFQIGATTGNEPTSGYPIFPVSASVPSTGGASVKTANYTLTASDCGLLLVYNSSSAGTFTLPAAPPFAQWQVRLGNIGTGTLTISRNGLLIDGAASDLTLPQNQGVEIATDNANYFTARGSTTGGSSTPSTLGVRTVTASTAVTSADYTILSDATAGAIVITFPPAPGAGRILNNSKVDSSTNTLTLDGNGKNIYGTPTVVIARPLVNLQTQYDGTGWRVL